MRNAQYSDIPAIANSFCKVLTEWLTPEEMKEVTVRNSTPEYVASKYDAVHEFCDANEAMTEAFDRLSLDFNLSSEEGCTMWDEAWKLARSNEYRINEGAEVITNYIVKLDEFTRVNSDDLYDLNNLRQAMEIQMAILKDQIKTLEQL